MSKLFLYEVTKQERKEVAALASTTVIGRDPGPGGIAIQAEGMSRSHATIHSCGGLWCLSDLNSTNGSWLNNEALVHGVVKILRDGDILQLAAAALQVSLPEGSTGDRALIVFRNGQYLHSYPVPEQGRALVIGGPGGDIKLEGERGNLAALIVEQRGKAIYGYRQSEAIRVELNAKPMGHMAELSDGDNILVEEFTVLFIDPQGAAATEANQQGQQRRTHHTQGAVTAKPLDPHSPAAMQQGGQAGSMPVEQQALSSRPQVPKRKSFANPAFGRSREPDLADSSDPYKSGAVPNPMHTHSGRYEAPPPRYHRSNPFSMMEDQILLIVGFLMLIVLFVLFLWLLFS